MLANIYWRFHIIYVRGIVNGEREWDMGQFLGKIIGERGSGIVIGTWDSF